MIRETPDPELLACEDYERHHVHGLQVPMCGVCVCVCVCARCVFLGERRYIILGGGGASVRPWWWIHSHGPSISYSLVTPRRHNKPQGLAELLTLSFIDIDSARRTFRFYCIQVRPLHTHTPT